MTSTPKLIHVHMIGQMKAWSHCGDDMLPIGRKARALLALLALNDRKPLSRARIAGLLWYCNNEDTARASLRQDLKKLREAMAPVEKDVLQISRDVIALNHDAVSTDVETVLLATPQRPESLSLLDGDLLECLNGINPAFDAWLLEQRQAFRDRCRVVAEGSLHLQTEPQPAIAAAKRLLQVDRSHEGAWRAIMRSYVQMNEIGQAVQAYDQCRSVLARLFDAVPSDETQQLLVAIRDPKHRTHLFEGRFPGSMSGSQDILPAWM